ncbi:hypothetical protein [Pseudomonas sp.]|uniref:hypothetical protein n=1 Tax=Pseudomonas sp. TaxID=306 RepID=UPI0025859D6F|nr:hypothetical protein [Pseudomonas sp.]
MPCEFCLPLHEPLNSGDELVWLDHTVWVTELPAGLRALDLKCYRLLRDARLAWRIDHFDAWGQPWIALQRIDPDASMRYELVRLEPGTYRLVPCEPPYPVIRHAACARPARTC